MIKKFDHVAMIVKDTGKSVSLLSDLFGFQIIESRTEPEQGFKSTLIAKEDVTLELIEPTGAGGPIQAFVEKRGPGLHHISVRVDDLEEETKRLKALGVHFTGDQPVRVTEDTRVIFVHPRSTDGLLIELIERK